MYVQPTADKMAASEYSRLVNTQKEANRMDPHNPHQMSQMYPGQKQVMYQSPIRGSIQTGMPAVPHGMDIGKNHPHKSVTSESSRRGSVGYSSAPHLVQRGGYPHGYQHQVNYPGLPSVVTSETSPFRRDHSAMPSHAEMMRSHNQMNQKSTNVFQTNHRSDASHLHKSYEQMNHGFQNHIGGMPRLERGIALPSHPTSVSGSIKDRNPGLKSHPQSYPSTQMHLNYQHEPVPISGLPNHPSYVSMDRRHSTNKHVQSSHIGYHEPQRGAGDSQRLGHSNPISAMPELIRVVDEPNSRIQSSLRQQGVINQNHRIGPSHRADHSVPSSIHKDHNRPAFPHKSIPSGQPSVFVNQDYSNSKVASNARVNPKESQHGSIQTGIPLDLSRVPEKPQISPNQKSSRETDSPLDLSVKTRKRCADTTINQYSNEADIISPKRQMVDHKQLPHNSINEQHYRHDFQKSIDSVYLNQAVQQHHRQQAYPHLHKEPVTIKADNSAAKSAGLLPRLTPEQNHLANIIYQNQKQLSSLKAQNAAQDAAIGGISPYPYSLYSGNQPSVIRCSPDSTNAQVYQHHQQSKQVHQLLKRTNLTQSSTAAQYTQQSLHNQKVQSPKGQPRNSKVDTLHASHPQNPRNQNFPHPVHTKIMSLPATSRSQQITHPPPLESKPGHAEFRTSSCKTSLPQTKSEPHMQLYPSYEKQSFTGPLPSNINLNRANSASTSNIYKTHVKPPEIMGLPSTDTEKQIMNTIKSVRNDEKPKTDKPKNALTETTPKTTETDSEQSEKYMEPLSIAIPFSKDSNEKSQKVVKSGEDKLISPAPPKVLSRKQMIMNAVIKDENLKKYATPMRKPKAGSEFKAPRSSPASPPSPKMPILSPQQKSLPSVSPLHSDPPTLDLLENTGKQRLKGRISHTIPKRPLDKVKAPIVKIPTENQETVPVIAKEEPKDTSYPRPEALRRNSLPEKTWMYNKNIPVANVAPFVHSEVKEEKFPAVSDSQPTLPGSNNQVDKNNVHSSENDEQKATTTDTSSPVTNVKKKERSSLEKVVVKAKLKNISARKKLALEKVKNNIESLKDLDDSKLLSKIEANRAKISRKSKSEKKMKSDLPDGPSLEEDVAAIDDAEAAGNLMTDPALLDREERALRRAIDQFNKMETGTKYPSSATTVRRQSNTNKRAQQLKKRAIKRNRASGRNKSCHIKGRSGLRSRGFIDFKPEVLKSRTRPTDERQIRKKVSSSSKNQRSRSRPRHDSDFEFDNAELDFLDDDDEEYDDDDDDEDATEYEYDSDELSQDRVLRQRVSLRTRKRPARHVDSDDTDVELDFQDDVAVNQSNKSSRTRRQQKANSRTGKGTTEEATGDAAQSEETTDDDFDAAFFRHEESSLLIPAEVKKITINKTTGETGLHKAVRLNYQEAVLYYLKSGTLDVNVKDNAGYSPLHEACSTGNLPVAKILLRHGADVNSSSMDGIRPLHDAVRSDHIEVVRLLLAFGADPIIQDGRGKSLLEISELPGMIRFLEGYLGDLNGFDSDAEDNPWQFFSCYRSGPVENGCNIFSDIPSDPEQDLEDDLFDDDITSAIRIFDLDLYNIGRSESYVFGEDIQSQFNCNETRLRKLCTPEMDVIKLPTEKFQKFFDNSVVRCPLTNNPTICLIKYAYYKDLKEKLTPTTKCSNVSDLISYRNKATERKVLNRSLTHNSDSSSKNGKKNTKSETKSTSVVKDVKGDTRQNKGQSSKYSLQPSSSCPSRLTTDTNEASSSQNNNNNNNNNQVNNNINNMKKRQSHMSVQVVLKKEMLSLGGKKSSKLESFKIRTPNTSSQETKNTNTKSISAVATSKYAFNDGDSN